MKAGTLFQRGPISIVVSTIFIFCLFWNCGASIIFPNAPPSGQQVSHQGLVYLLQGNPNLLNKTPIEELTITNSFQAYNATPEDVISHNLLLSAKLAVGRWQFFVMHGKDAVGIVELKVEGQSGKQLKFVGLHQELASRMQVALQKAETISKVSQQAYEFRLLRIPSMEFSSVWLHGEGDDIIIPLPPTWGKWNGYQFYSKSQITRLLYPEAEKKLKTRPGLVD